MLMMTGYLEWSPSLRNHGRIRMCLTDEGWRYLHFLKDLRAGRGSYDKNLNEPQWRRSDSERE